MDIAFTVNGAARSVAAPETATLLDILRNQLGLMGTRYGCGLEQCGCCMVLVDGQPAYACTREVGTVADRKVTTIEGLAHDETLHPVQAAFIAHDAMQCGFCTPGMIMSVRQLLRDQPNPSESEIRHYLTGNICRCTGYHNIVRAVESLATVAHHD